MTSQITHHAYRRARQRLHWPRAATVRMAQRALDHGTPVAHLGQSPAPAVDAPFYRQLGAVLYVFSPQSADNFNLLTLYPIDATAPLEALG